LVIGFNYETPRLNNNALTRVALSNWTFGGVLRYSSGFPIRIPGANNGLGGVLLRSTYANRVPGEPLFLTDLNDRSSIDPFKTLTLNPESLVRSGAGGLGLLGGLLQRLPRGTTSG
jgi:hypothetical protein